MPEITVGLRVPHELPGGAAGLREFVGRAEATGVDRLCVGDHVTFQDGRGFDGLLTAAALAVASRRLVVQTAVYLLALRHPVPVARQIVTLAGLAGGRLIFGVGLGGDDPGELLACGVNPGTRGRRLDEALAVLRPLLAGQEVTLSGSSSSWTGCASGPPRSRRCRSSSAGGPRRRCAGWPGTGTAGSACGSPPHATPTPSNGSASTPPTQAGPRPGAVQREWRRNGEVGRGRGAGRGSTACTCGADSAPRRRRPAPGWPR